MQPSWNASTLEYVIGLSLQSWLGGENGIGWRSDQQSGWFDRYHHNMCFWYKPIVKNESPTQVMNSLQGYFSILAFTYLIKISWFFMPSQEPPGFRSHHGERHSPSLRPPFDGKVSSLLRLRRSSGGASVIINICMLHLHVWTFLKTQWCLMIFPLQIYTHNVFIKLLLLNFCHHKNNTWQVASCTHVYSKHGEVIQQNLRLRPLQKS